MKNFKQYINEQKLVSKENKNNIDCFLCNYAVSFDFVQQELLKKNIKINKKDYVDSCKRLGLRYN